VTAAAQAVAPEERPAARLGLLSAMASYQVDDADVAAFKDGRRRGDGELVELVSWASFEAARRAGARISPPGGDTGPAAAANASTDDEIRGAR
jgi:hypothetical protein